MSLLTIIQDVTDRLANIPRPLSVKGSWDDTVRQMSALANEEGQELASTYQWQAMTRRVEHKLKDNPTSSSSPAIDVGSLDELAPDYLYIIDDTIWIANQPYKLVGPVSAQGRTGLEAWNMQGATWYYWIEGNRLYITRPTYSGQTLLFRYQSKNWVKKADGTLTDRMREDSDTPILPERCIILGVVWRWLERNGLPYHQELVNWQKAVSQYAGRDGTNGVIRAGGTDLSYSPQNSIIGGVLTS